jgi:hypothetical protein
MMEGNCSMGTGSLDHEQEVVQEALYRVSAWKCHITLHGEIVGFEEFIAL